ncbi:MAG: hypothetical protein HY961_13445 [Ignavibacteriae bacterium]|nr:hypothetical protein [Ignavibacteriota bacterium]
MRTILCVLALFIGFSFAASQDLFETGTIDINDGEINDFYLERNTDNNQYYLLVLLRKGGLKVFNAKRELVFQRVGVRSFVYWGDTYLHNNILYFFETQELYGLNFDDFKTAKAPSQRLPHDLYTHYRAYKDKTSELLVAENDTIVDVYQFPDLDSIARLKRQTGEYSYYVDGLVVYNARRRDLFAFNLNEKKMQWKIDAGERKAKFMGISLGVFPGWWMRPYWNPDDNLVYARTSSGDLYKIKPKSGEVVLKKEQFRGDANNAGLLTRMYFKDMNGDGKNEIVSPSVDENIYCIDPKDFTVKWVYEAENENQMPLAFYDITGDGIPEVFSVCDYDLMLSILDGSSGKLIMDFELKKEHKKFNQTYVVVADIDGNGYLDIITQSSRQKIRFLELKTPKLPTSGSKRP